MKRTLLEILGGLTVLILVIVFTAQVSNLKIQNRDIDQIRALAESTAASASSKQEILDMRRQLLGQIEDRLLELEGRLAEANRTSQEALELKQAIETARLEVDRITDDFLQTKDLVNGYVDEARAKDHRAQAALATLAEKLTPDPSEMTRSMLAPTVQLNGKDTVGSGTLIFSGKNPRTGIVESYVLTSYHVVRNILSDMSRAQKEEGIDVTIYLDEDEQVEVKGKMVEHSVRIDAALVKLRSNRVFPNVAYTLPRALRGEVELWEPVFAVGCPLGNDPIPTKGTVSSLDNELNGSNYWMINAPTYFGNSGGGVYLANTRELIGVFSKIYTHGQGNPVVIPHMGLCTPISLVHEWLEKKKLDYVLQAAEVDVASPAPAKPAAPGK